MPEQPTHTFFNSRCAEYKTPFGAVPAGQTVTWRLTVPERLGYVDPHLVLTKDREDPVHYRMDFDGQTPGVNHFVFQLAPTTSGLYFYHFDLYTDFRKIYRTANGEGELTWVNGLDWQLTVYEPDFKTPDWIKDGTMYQIFPDRFCEGVENKPMPFPDRLYQADKHAEPFWQPNETGGHLNEDYFGGDLEGIRIKLPYLREMGVDYLYLNPIFEAHSNHRYNTADYLNVDPLLGTNEEFEVLCREAAKYGIGIVLDGVFSHTGSDSRYFNREGRYGEGGAYRDPNSPYRSWYDFDPKYKGGYRSWWGFETLPEVDEETPSYVEFITGPGGVIDTWLRRGAAGFRLDVADELPDEFIEKVRAAVKRVSPEKFLLGEVWEDATTKFGFDKRRTYLLGKGLDAVMNYPLGQSIKDFWIDKSLTNEDFEYTINRCYTSYMQQTNDVLFNLLDSHDTKRLRSDVKNLDEYFAQIAVLFAMPGSPCIYYGTEIAMEGSYDPDCRRCMPWSDIEAGKYAERSRIISTLIHLRRQEPLLKSRNFHFPNDYAAYRRVIQFQKVDFPDCYVEVLINCCEEDVEVVPQGEILLERHYIDSTLLSNGILIRRIRK